MTAEEFTNAHPALVQFWHPVALSSEVSREPVAARLGGLGWAPRPCRRRQRLNVNSLPSAHRTGGS
jgi:hypothetical protein